MMTDRERGSDLDADSIDAIRRGDREAFECLVKKYQRMVEAVAYSTNGERALVDDIVQDTFLVAWRTIDRLRDSTRARAWLYGIARNVACNARRRRREPRIDAVPGSPTPFDRISEHERDDEVARALARLPASYREPLVLFYYEQCTVKEVADALAVGEDAALQRLSRGRRKLGETLASKVEVELERKPSRAALVASVLALLPIRAATASTVSSGAGPASTASSGAGPASTASSGAGPASTASSGGAAEAGSASAKPLRWPSLVGALAARRRMVLGVVACAFGGAIVVLASERSREIAAVDAHRATTANEEPAPVASPPRLPESPAALTEPEDLRIYGNISTASDDAAETCARGARGLVFDVLGKDAFQVADGKVYFRPSLALQRTAEAIATRAGETCRLDRWPELYVKCEATLEEIERGDVGCYPYDPFASS